MSSGPGAIDVLRFFNFFNTESLLAWQDLGTHGFHQDG